MLNTTINSMISVFITNLGKYNEGELVGEWVNLPVSDDELEKVFSRIGIDGEEYEEIFITDYESEVPGVTVDEYDSIEDLNELAESLELLDGFDFEIVGAMLSQGYDFEYALNHYDDCYFYEGAESMEDVARQYCEDCGLLDGIPDDLKQYFDFEAYGDNMDTSGTFVFTNSGCVEIVN